MITFKDRKGGYIFIKKVNFFIVNTVLRANGVPWVNALGSTGVET